MGEEQSAELMRRPQAFEHLPVSPTLRDATGSKSTRLCQSLNKARRWGALPAIQHPQTASSRPHTVYVAADLRVIRVTRYARDTNRKTALAATSG